VIATTGLCQVTKRIIRDLNPACTSAPEVDRTDELQVVYLTLNGGGCRPLTRSRKCLDSFGLGCSAVASSGPVPARLISKPGGTDYNRRQLTALMQFKVEILTAFALAALGALAVYARRFTSLTLPHLEMVRFRSLGCCSKLSRYH
jgi:hypothetical protein